MQETGAGYPAIEPLLTDWIASERRHLHLRKVSSALAEFVDLVTSS